MSKKFARRGRRGRRAARDEPTLQPAMWRSRTTSRVALMAVTHATVADSARLWSSRGCGIDALPYAPMTLAPATSSGSATQVAFRWSSSASPAV